LLNIRKEALLNEYKGNLYEFIFASLLARKFSLEGIFYQNLGADIKEMLEYQEKFLREFYPELILDLPKLAQSLVDDFITNLKIKKINNIEIIGKVALASQDNRYGEADVLVQSEKAIYPLSIKLGKAQSYLNTKSAGIKSFFQKYFASFAAVESIQNDFNQFYDQAYLEFSMQMHQAAEIDYLGGFKNWSQHNLPELPGQLTDEFKDLYKAFSLKVSQKLLGTLYEFSKLDKEKFLLALKPLLGFSNDQVIQVSTYYKKVDESYHFFGNRIDQFNKNIKLETFNLKEQVNYCDIELSDRILQIRLKAMNKFTHASFKVNCSVKYKS
tara:strand:- start:155701 stop:156681 length:981 start_codon:yes stop_codon:yes gene_type:complete